MNVLPLLKDARHREYEVRYYTLDSPAAPADGGSKILRLRTRLRDGRPAEYRLTYKERGDDAPGTSWSCPLGTAVEYQADVTVLGQGTKPKQQFARSCEIESNSPPTVPGTLSAKPPACFSKMTRDEAKDPGETRVERWVLPDGSELLEVSRRAEYSDEALDRFEKEIAQPLRQAGVEPIESSKTSAATCPP